MEWGALVILGGCIVLFGFMPSLILDFINRVTPDYLAVLTRVDGVAMSWDQLSPLSLDLLLAVASCCCC